MALRLSPYETRRLRATPRPPEPPPEPARGFGRQRTANVEPTEDGGYLPGWAAGEDIAPPRRPLSAPEPDLPPQLPSRLPPVTGAPTPRGPQGFTRRGEEFINPDRGGFLNVVGNVSAPFDYTAEVGQRLFPAERLLPVAGPASDISGALGGPRPIRPFRPSPRGALRAATHPEEAVESFRSRPVVEQMIAGTVYDPTNLIGVGAGPEVARAGVRLKGFAREALQEQAPLRQGGREVAAGVRRLAAEEAGAVGKGAAKAASDPAEVVSRALRADRVDLSREIDPEYLYHATSRDNAFDIAETGRIKTHGPSFGTDQAAWPDGGTLKRTYFTETPATASSFFPESGQPTLLRVRRSSVPFKKERGTTDIFVERPIKTSAVEVLTDKGWEPMMGPPPAAGTLAPKGKITPEAIHALADEKGIPWDNDPAFLARTKRITGEEHLDALGPAELRAVYAELENAPAVGHGVADTADLLAQASGAGPPSGHAGLFTPEAAALFESMRPELVDGEWRAGNPLRLTLRNQQILRDAGMPLTGDTTPRQAEQWLREASSTRGIPGQQARIAAEQAASAPLARNLEANFDAVPTDEDFLRLSLRHRATPEGVAAMKAREAAQAARGVASADTQMERDLAASIAQAQAKRGFTRATAPEQARQYRGPRGERPAATTAEQAAARAAREQGVVEEAARNAASRAPEDVPGILPPANPPRGPLPPIPPGGGTEPPLPGMPPISKRPSTIGEMLLDAANLARAIKASFDVSASGRQGLFFAPGHPVEWLASVKDNLVSFRSAEGAARVRADLEALPHFEALRKLGTFYATTDGPLSAREEAYMTRWASKIPGMKASERSYTNALNSLRFRIGSTIYEGWSEEKRARSGELLAKFLNEGSGRGTLGKVAGVDLGTLAPALNAAFFSPRNFAAKIQIPYNILLAPVGKGYGRDVGMLAARDLLAFVGTGTAALGMMKLAGADIELDPRSTDFGKGRWGPLRVDFWAGYQQIARYTAQLASGQALTGKGLVEDRDRWETIGRFLRSKLAPTPGAVIDLIAGSNVVGDARNLSPASLLDQAVNTFIPFTLQAIIDGAKDSGPIGAALYGVTSATGFGVNSYGDEQLKVRDAGLWQIDADVWRALQAESGDDPEYDDVRKAGSYESWRSNQRRLYQEVIAEEARQAGIPPDGSRVKDAVARALANDPVVQAMRRARTDYKGQWVAGHPREARIADSKGWLHLTDADERVLEAAR